MITYDRLVIGDSVNRADRNNEEAIISVLRSNLAMGTRPLSKAEKGRRAKRIADKAGGALSLNENGVAYRCSSPLFEYLVYGRQIRVSLFNHDVHFLLILFELNHVFLNLGIPISNLGVYLGKLG